MRGEKMLAVVLKDVEEFMERTHFQQLVLSMAAGAFISFGALLSVVLSLNVDQAGPRQLLLGLGFVAGFSTIMFTGTSLFTAVNMSMPLYLYRHNVLKKRILAGISWVIVWVGNVLGALLFAAMVKGSDPIDAERAHSLDNVMNYKTRQKDLGTFGAWMRVFASGMLANWLVGIAAYHAKSSSTLTGKLAGVFFPLVAFSAIGFEHSPANMGYFFIGLIDGRTDVSWSDAWEWNIIPSSLGNLAGAVLFVSLPFMFAFNASSILKGDSLSEKDVTEDPLDKKENDISYGDTTTFTYKESMIV